MASRPAGVDQAEIMSEPRRGARVISTGLAVAAAVLAALVADLSTY